MVFKASCVPLEAGGVASLLESVTGAELQLVTVTPGDRDLCRRSVVLVIRAISLNEDGCMVEIKDMD
jgi:hypothetical protein